jgi:hypothetical protein
MVKIPDYQAQQGLQVGGGPSLPGVDTTGARALQSVGGAVADLGASLQTRQDKLQDDRDKSWFSKARADASVGWTERKLALKNGATGTDAAGFSDLAGKEWTGYRAGVAKGAPSERAKGMFDQWADAFGANDAVDSIDFREKSLFAARGADFESAFEAHKKSVVLDPKQYDRAVALFEDDLEIAKAWMTPEQERAARDKGLGQLQSARLGEIIRSDPAGFLQEVGGSAVENTVAKIIGVESGGRADAKNPRSSASGLGQFTDSTWLATVRKHRPDLAGASNGEILALKTDPTIGRQMTMAHTQENAAALAASGNATTEGNLYLAHFAGIAGAKRILAASDGSAIVDVLGSDVVRANPFLRDQNIGWLKGWAAKKMGGQAPPPSAALDDPRLSHLTADQLVSFRNQAETQQRENQVLYRAGLEGQVQDATAAYMTVGRYDGATPGQQDFVNAYGAQRGPQEYSAFQRVVETGQQIDAIKSMTTEDQRSLLESQKPVGAGPGFAAEQGQYETLHKAVEYNQQQRQADPSAYVQMVYPGVKAAWSVAGQSPAAFQTALAATSAAQTQLGIPANDQRLLPKDIAKKAADTFKQPDLSQDQRIAAIASTVFATTDPAQQSAIFRQLVDAGLPDMTEGAVRAFARGDQAAAERLMQAVMINPKDLPGKIAASEGDINQAIQDEVMAEGEIGDLAYGLSFGQSENLVTAERDGKLLSRSVQLRMAGGEDLDAAIAGARKDLFGPVQAVDGTNAQALIPETADAGVFSSGVDALLPQVEQVIRAAYPEPEASGAAKAIVNASRENRIKDIVSNGSFRNTAGGFAFFDPYSGRAVPGPDGKPATFTLDQIMSAGNEAPNGRTGDPLANANNPNSQFNAARSVTQEQPAQAAPAAPTDAVTTTSDPLARTAPLSLQERLSDAQRSAVSAAVRAISAGADPKAITDRLRKAGVPEELWPK